MSEPQHVWNNGLGLKSGIQATTSSEITSLGGGEHMIGQL